MQSNKRLVAQCQGNVDYSFFGDLNIQPRGYINATFEKRISLKGNFVLCFMLIFTFVGLYSVQRKHDLDTRYLRNMNTSMHLKH